MGATLEALLELQDIELQIVDIRRQLAQKTRMVARQTAKLSKMREHLEEKRAELRRTQAQVDELDLDLKARTANVDRFREHLNTVRTNKEYAAVLGHLNNEKADASRLEAKALELMAGVELRKSELREQEQEEKTHIARLEGLEAQMRQTGESFAGKLTDLERRRAEAAEKLPPEAQKLFDRVSERYEGEAMALVVRTHPRRDEFMCDGCNMSLAAERANFLMTRDDVLTCDNCGRILYVEAGT
ncbi:MAG: hypothetical protein KKB50_01205 [Planctomycetes bacterium]|nr:hypothetical protein [Planctomycetota bacterium]